MPLSLESRIEALARRDRALAITFTILMWAVLIFVFMAASAAAPNTAIRVVLVAAMLTLGLFNTASALALLRRYAESRDAIYRPDLVNLDKLREVRELNRRNGR